MELDKRIKVNNFLPADATRVARIADYELERPAILRTRDMNLVDPEEANKRIKRYVTKQKLIREEEEERARKKRIEEEKEAERARIAKEDEERRKRNAEYYKKLAEKQNELHRKQLQEDAKKADEQYEKDYASWQKDIKNNPSRYNDFTKYITSTKNTNPLFVLNNLVGNPFSRLYFGLKNATGAGVISSIETNGQSILGKIDLNDIYGESARAHLKDLEINNRLNELRQQLDDLVLRLNTANPQEGSVGEFSKLYNNIELEIRDLQQQLQDPTLRELDNLYKQNYTREFGGTGTHIKKMLRDFRMLMTYDLYKEERAKLDQQEEISDYYDILINNSRLRGLRGRRQFDTVSGQYDEQTEEYNRSYDFPATFDSKTNTYTTEEGSPLNLQSRSAYINSQGGINKIDETETRQKLADITAQNKVYTKAYKENRDHLAQATRDWDVAKYYKYGQSAYREKPLWSPYYWYYEVPDMMGSTLSSPEQAKAMFMLYGGMIASAFAAPVSGGASTAMFMGSQALSFPHALEGGKDENRAEIHERRIENIMSILKHPSSGRFNEIMGDLMKRSAAYWKTQGWTKELIQKYLEGEEGQRHAIGDYISGLTVSFNDNNGNPIYANENTDPELFSALLYSTQGLAAQYDADNMRTMSDLILQTAVMATPTGGMRRAIGVWWDKAASKILSKEAINKIEVDAAGRVTARTAESEVRRAVEDGAQRTYKNGFRPKSTSASEAFARGRNVGAAFGEMAGLGTVGAAIGGAAGGFINTAAYLGREMLSPAARGLFNRVEEGIMHKYMNVYDLIVGKSEWRRAIAKYGFRTMNSAFISSMSEGAEEAVLYLNSKEDFAKKYGWGGMSLGQMIINDVYQGGRVMNSYFALLGISDSELLNDAEYWANLKGGFALGGFHTGLLRLGVNGVDAYKTFDIQNYITASAAMSRELDQKDRAAGMEFARVAMRGNGDALMDVVDYMEAQDRKREQPYFTQEDYDEKRKLIRHIIRLANSEDVKKNLEAKGILYNTEEYAATITDLAKLSMSQYANKIEALKNMRDQDAFYNSKEMAKAIDDIVDEIYSDPSIFAERNRIGVEAGQKAVEEERARAKEAGEDIESEEFKKHLRSIRTHAHDEAIQNHQLSARLTAMDVTKLALTLMGLLSVKAQSNTIEDFFSFLQLKFNLKPMRPDAKRILDSIEEQIKEIKREISERLTRFNANFSDAAAIEFLKSSPYVVHLNEDEALRLHVTQAMLNADASVTQKYLDLYLEGLVTGADGSVEYNPLKSKQLKKRNAQLQQKLKNKEITKEEYDKQIKEDIQIASRQEDVDNNPYKKRIESILKAKKENGALNWMVNDILNGDGVTQLMAEYEADVQKLQEEEAKQQAKQQEENPFESLPLAEQQTVQQNQETQPAQNTLQSSTEPVQLQPTIATKNKSSKKSNLQKAKQKYERRIARVQRQYNSRKKKIRNFRRGSLNSAIPFLDLALDAINNFIRFAEFGVFKFAELVERMQITFLDLNINEIMPQMKKAYITQYFKYKSENNPAADNMSTPEEVFNYGSEQTVQPVVESKTNPLYKLIQDQIDEDNQKVIESISTHFDRIVKNDDGTVTVYTNYEALWADHLDENHVELQRGIKTLTDANTSEESFRKALQEYLRGYDIPIEDYVKYRNTEGIIPAIVHNRLRYIPTVHISHGVLVKDAVISVLNGTYDQIDRSNYPEGFDNFVNDILLLKDYIENTLGLHIITGGRYIYGKDSLGRNVCSQTDLICADDKDLIHIIKIRSSYQSIRANWNIPQYKSGFTIGSQVVTNLKQTEQIINNKFNLPVSSLNCLPVMWSDTISVEKDEDSMLIVLKADQSERSDKSIEEFKNQATILVENANSLIKEFNAMVQYSSRYTSQFGEERYLVLLLLQTDIEYQQYINQLKVRISLLNSKIEDIRNLVELNRNLENEIWLEEMESSQQVEAPINILAAYENLQRICKDLDIVLDDVLSLRITTEDEDKLVRRLYQLIYEALVALDDFLQEPDSQTFDVRAEELLIASALEKLSENKDKFGRLSTMVRLWWATNFVIGKTTNSINMATNEDVAVSNIGELWFFGPLNKINQWINTYENHVLQELDGSIPLLRWYSAILNNYFSKLLDNTESLSSNLTDPVLISTIQEAVQRGRRLIDDFNKKWDMRPEEGFDGPIESPAWRINRMPVKWWNRYTVDDSCSPSFNEMINNTAYYVISNQPGFAESGYFHLEEQNGMPVLYATYTGPRKNPITVKLSFINDIDAVSASGRKAKDFLTQDEILRWLYVNQQRMRTFIPKCLAALRLVASDKDRYELKFDVVLDKGKIKYGEADDLHTLDEFLFKGEQNAHDLFTIKLSKKDNIGILSTIETEDGKPNIYTVRGGKGFVEIVGRFNDEYEKGQTRVRSGMLVYFYNTGDGKRIGVPLVTKKIGIEDAQKIVYLLELLSSGQTLANGYDIMQLLRQRVYIQDPKKQHTQYNNESNMIILSGREIIIGGEKYNFVDKKQDLINRISIMSNATRKEVLDIYMGTSTDLVFDRVRRVIDPNDTSASIQLPNGIIITWADLFNRNQDGSVGSTFLGYMIRNGYILTSAKKASYRQLNIKNLHVVDHAFDSVLQQEQQSSTLTMQQLLRALEDELDKISSEKEVVLRDADETSTFILQVQEYFEKVLGKNGAHKFVENNKDFLGRISRNKVILGRCSEALIEMSTAAPLSVAWHEAFHKIFELIIPAEQRDAFYEQYKKRSLFSNPSDRDAAEWFADKFMRYMQNKNQLDKADSLIKKFIPYCKKLAHIIGMFYKLGFRKGRLMFDLYNKINAGTFKDREITQEQKDRFRRLFGEGLNYEITNVETGETAEFTHMHGVQDRDALVRGISYYILKNAGVTGLNPDVSKIKIFSDDIKSKRATIDMIPQGIRDILTREGAPDDQLTETNLLMRELFESKEVVVSGKDGKPLKKTIYPKFAALSKYIADYISGVVNGERRSKIDDIDTDKDTDQQNGGAENKDETLLNHEKYDRAAYEFSKLDNVSAQVKLFFSTIPRSSFEDSEETGKRKAVLDYSTNPLGLPELLTIDETYKMVVNKCNTASTIQELLDQLSELAKSSPVFLRIFNKFNNLVNGTKGKDGMRHGGIYQYDEDGNIKSIDYDREAFALLIVLAVHSFKIDFVTSLSTKLEFDGKQGKKVLIKSSSLDRDAKRFPDQWTQYLVAGQVGIFKPSREEDFTLDAEGNKKRTKLVFRDGVPFTIFKDISLFFRDVLIALFDAKQQFTIEGKEYNKLDYDSVDKLKNEIISKLNKIGILFSKSALDNMLIDVFGGADVDGLFRWFNSMPVDDKMIDKISKSSINRFIDVLDLFVSDNGVINKRLIEEDGYGSIGFVRLLAEYLGIYLRITTQNMAYALNGKKVNSISQNNTISHNIDAFNTHDQENETVRVLSGFGYNLTKEVSPQGSIILKNIRDVNSTMHLLAHVYLGSKTDNHGDQGSEYVDEATVDDYIAKLTMLQQGYLLSPTLADKGTWIIISGLDIPGMKFSSYTDNNGQSVLSAENVPEVKFINGRPYFVPSDAVLNQMIEYANTERLAIQQCMEDLGYENIPGYKKTGRHILSDSEKVENYHTENVDKKTGKVIEPNGTRFLSLTSITVKEYNPKTKKNELVTYNLNDPRERSVDLLKLANEKFFNIPGLSREELLEKQKEILSLTLAKLIENEVETAIGLGLIERVDISEKTAKGHLSVSKTSGGIMNLDTHNMNEELIDVLTRYYRRTTNAPETVARSFAISAILADATLRHIICSLEMLRCFIGHPAQFKVLYDVERGVIKDSTFDIQKRIGGLVSTGDDNVINLPGIDSEYTCAECKDYEVSSASLVADKLTQMFTDTQVRYVYGARTGDWETAYSSKVEDLLNTEDIKQDLLKAVENGKLFAKSFKKGINVADGAAYITEEMCENLLRMRGAYNNEVKKAFDLLRSSSPQRYSWMDVAEAYKTVYDAVNIVTTKYTAYGFREHSQNGEIISDMAVAYYNKYALFPLFPCLATGRMEGIYKKMRSEGVECLMMQSAVKVGSQGAVEFNGSEIVGKFNKYRQSYSYLRRQLNTDPEEGDKSTLGTLMIKIVLLNLILGRTNYIDSKTGKQVSGEHLLHTLMGAILRLAEIGVKEVNEMFFTEGLLDEKKLSTYLNDQLTSRNANRTLVQAIQSKLGEDGKYHLNAPLAATTDAQWIESILISTVNKKVIDITTPGSSFIQRSVFAIEDGTLLNETEAKHLYDGKRLEMLNEEGSMDAVVSIDFFLDILPDGLSFNEAREWLIKNGLIGGSATTIGYRIPTLAQSSIHALRFVDVVPATKTTIILPEEFTKITGSDFDIDHLYLARYNYKLDENGNVIKDFEEGSKEYYQNTIIDTMMTLLKDSENSINCLYKSIDNDTDLAKHVADLIPEVGSTKAEPFNFGTLHELVLRKNDYITGKKGIGPFALNVTNQILTQLYGVSFKETQFTRETGIMRFDKLLDDDGNMISSWLSAFINAHVDIVKDPWISKLDVNPFTYNMLNMLIRSGWGETALWFLSQPIIREMALANDRSNSQYIKDLDNSKNGGSSRDAALLEAVRKFLSEDAVSEQNIKKYTESTDKSDIANKIQTVNWLKDNRDILQYFATHPNAGEYKGHTIQSVQETVFYAWKSLEKYSVALGDFVLHTKIDTRKHGKNLIAINRYLRDYNSLFNPSSDEAKESLWDQKSLEHLRDNSWIGYKTRNAIDLPMRILGGQTFNGNIRFMNAVLKLAKTLQYDGRKLQDDGITAISRSMQTAIKSKYFVKYAKEVLNMSDKDIANLFVGNKSISRRLVRLKDAIENNPKYAYLKGNTLIAQIYSPIEDKPIFANGRMTDKPSFITVLDNVDESKVNSDLLTEGWLDLLNDSDTFVSTFARQLIVYAALTSGEFNGWNKLLKYIPYEFIDGQIDPQFESYSDFIRKQLSSYSTYEEYFDDIVSNNFLDYRFVKKMKEVNADGSKNFVQSANGVKIGASVSNKQQKEVAKYIAVKIQGAIGYGPAVYELYKQIGFIKSGKDSYNPVYVRMPRKGYHKTGYDIYEYGWRFGYAENGPVSDMQFNFDEAFASAAQALSTGVVSSLSDKAAIAVSRAYNQIADPQPEKTANTIEPGAHIATRGYKKGDPQKHPKFNYVFTDNAQAYVAAGWTVHDGVDVSQTDATIKLNVSDVDGTNQAGIRTDDEGNITNNAFGVVVKKRLQDENGNWLAKEGQFEDTEEDFKIFTDLNNNMFMRLENSINNPVNPRVITVFPQQIARGKAALPKRFAEWLLTLLLDRFGVVSEIVENERSDYEGYGLNILRVEPKESNLRQSRIYDWKYEGDSWYSGVLEELDLPEKIRMNGGMTYSDLRQQELFLDDDFYALENPKRLGGVYKQYDLNYNTELKLQETKDFNPFSYFKARNYSVLCEKSSKAFENYRKKLMYYRADNKVYGYPSLFFDDVTKVLYIKSNSYKNSRKYDVIDSRTGEYIKYGITLFTYDEFEKSHYKISKKEQTVPKTFSPARSINFSLLRQLPSKNRYKAVAKLFIYDAINPQENTINFKIIDDFIDSMPDALWDYVSSDVYGFNRDVYIGPFVAGSIDTSDITAATSKINSLDLLVNISKLGLIKFAEQITGIKLLGRRTKFNMHGKKLPNKNRSFGESVTLDNNLTRPEIEYLIEKILTEEYFKPSTTRENIEHYAKHKGVSVDQVMKEIELNREYDDIYSSKANEFILNYNWQLVEFKRNLEHKWNKTVSDYINNKYKDKFTKNDISFIDLYFKGILPWIKIEFNLDSGQSEDANSIDEPFIRLASVIHEPFHALHALSYGSPEELLLRNAYNKLINTEFGKKLHSLVKSSLSLNVTEDGIYKETCAYIFLLINTPSELIDMMGDQFLSTKIYNLIKDILELPIETEIRKTQQVDTAVEIQEQDVKLNFIQKVRNFLVSTLHKILPIAKKYTKLINSTVRIEKEVLVSSEVETSVETEKSKIVQANKSDFLNKLDQFETAIKTLLNIDGTVLSSVNIPKFFNKNGALYLESGADNFLNQDFELSEEEQREAYNYKKACEGGKI